MKVIQSDIFQSLILLVHISLPATTAIWQISVCFHFGHDLSAMMYWNIKSSLDNPQLQRKEGRQQAEAF